MGQNAIDRKSVSGLRIAEVNVNTIITHPANLAALRAAVDRGEHDPPRDPFPMFELRTNPHMERDKPTGRYYIEGAGWPLPPEEIEIDCGFYTYGPEDLEFLLMAGMVTEEREALFYVMDNPFYFNTEFPITPEPRSIIITSVV